MPDTGKWSVQWSEGNTVATFVHDQPFECCGETYRFQITDGTDTFGNSIERGPVPNPWAVTTAYPPQIDSVSPPTGLPGVQTRILIKGAEFLETPQVFIGSVEAQEVSFREPETITAMVPDTLGEGVYDITVVNPDTQSGTLEDAFEITEDIPGDDDDDDDDGCGCRMSQGIGGNGSNGTFVPFLLITVLTFLTICLLTGKRAVRTED